MGSASSRFTSHDASPALWERELAVAAAGAGAASGESLSRQRPLSGGRFGGTTQSHPQGADPVADPRRSATHKYFTWHVLLVSTGFVLSRFVYLWYHRYVAAPPADPRSPVNNQAPPRRADVQQPAAAPTLGPVDAQPAAAPAAAGDEVVGSPSVHPHEEATPNVALGRWIPIRALGRGSFGTVTLARNDQSGMYAAIKEVPVGEAGQLSHEFGLLCDLRPHPHVVRVLGAAIRGSRARLFLEYCPNGSLADVLQARTPQPEAYVRSCVRQILEGLAFLHSHNILHRDIKPANILIDAQGALKIADFGLSRHLDSLKTHTMQAGSPAYMSPESVRGQLSVGSDLWSVGATMVEMLSGELPWAHADAFRAGKEPLLLYIGTHPGDHPRIPDSVSSDTRGLLEMLFRSDPKDRGTATLALLHPYFKTTGPMTPSVTATTSFGGLTAVAPAHEGQPSSAGNDATSTPGGHGRRRYAPRRTPIGPPTSTEVAGDGPEDTTTMRSTLEPPPLVDVVGVSTLRTDSDVTF